VRQSGLKQKQESKYGSSCSAALVLNLFHKKTAYERASSFWVLATMLPFLHTMIRFRYMSFGPLLQHNIKTVLFSGTTVELIFREKRRGMLGYLHNPFFPDR